MEFSTIFLVDTDSVVKFLRRAGHGRTAGLDLVNGLKFSA